MEQVDRGRKSEVRRQKTEVRSQRSEDRRQTTEGRRQRTNDKDSPVGEAFPVLPVPGVVPGSLLALSLSKGSKGSPLSVATTIRVK